MRGCPRRCDAPRPIWPPGLRAPTAAAALAKIDILLVWFGVVASVGSVLSDQALGAPDQKRSQATGAPAREGPRTLGKRSQAPGAPHTEATEAWKGGG